MTLPLKELFVYPIERYIPPVAKVEDVEEATAAAELREYVVTTPIERALVDFLEVYAISRITATDRIGVWISGFFGSGKSHFAKVLSYLLANPIIEGQAAREIFLGRLAGSPRRAEIEGLLHRAGLLDSRVMMFNIKTEQDQQAQDESISQIIYRRYLTSRGLSANPMVASLELSLIDRGLFDDFRAEVEERIGAPWEEEREDFLFVRSTVADALQAVAPKAYRTREEALDALEMVKESQRLTVSDLVERLVDYVDDLAEQGDPERPPRLVFILDEMGQFIGTDGDRLLELQSIAEAFGTQGRGKLWLIVTAQAKLHEIVGGAGSLQADFGKIGDRFDTRLALTAEDVERVLEGRILKKEAAHVPAIGSFYHDHEGSLAMLASLPGASRDLPTMTVDEFTADTPFLPYHPMLIQAIFANVRGATATGFSLNPEARSMIGMAQGVLSNPANGFVDGELGRTVALDMVYDQIVADLQPQDRWEIDGLPDQLPSYRPLDQRVLKALYLLQAVPWIAVTAATLAHALVRDVRTESVAILQAEVEESLGRLKEARYVVAKEGGVWEFLTGAKKSFEEEVAGVTVRRIDLRRETRRYLGQVLRPIGKLNYRSGMRSFDVTVQGDGETFQSGGDIVLEVYSPLYVESEDVNVSDLEMVVSFSNPETVYWVAAESPDLSSHLTRAFRLGKVLGRWRAKPSKSDEDREIVREKDTELNSLEGKIATALRVALVNGTIVWNGRSEELDGRTTTLNPIFNRHLSPVVPHVYPKFELAAVKPSESDIKAVLTVDAFALPTVGSDLDLFGQDGHLNQHSAVVEEIQGELEQRSHRGGEMSGKALEEHFTGGDYGWHPVIVRLVLAAMFRAGLVSVKADNVHYVDHTVPAAQRLFTQTRPFRRAVFFYEETVAVDPDELRRVQDELKVIFDARRREETANVLAEQIDEEMNEWNDRVTRLLLQLRPAGYPIPDALRGSETLTYQVTRFNNPGKVIKAFLEHLEDVRAWHAEARVLYDFVREKRLPVFQRARRLLGEIERAAGMPGTGSLTTEDARRWRGELRRLIDTGHAAHEWDVFIAALTPLEERYREAYATLHAARDEAVTEAEARLADLDMPVEQPLQPYRCSELAWEDSGIACANCQAALKELPLQTAAIPPLVGELREKYDVTPPLSKEVRRLRVVDVVPKRRIESEDELEEVLDALRDAVSKALGEANAVELE